MGSEILAIINPLIWLPFCKKKKKKKKLETGLKKSRFKIIRFQMFMYTAIAYDCSLTLWNLILKKLGFRMLPDFRSSAVELFSYPFPTLPYK